MLLAILIATNEVLRNVMGMIPRHIGRTVAIASYKIFSFFVIILMMDDAPHNVLVLSIINSKCYVIKALDCSSRPNISNCFG